MHIAETSRYFSVSRGRTKDGIAYLRRRFLPQASMIPALQAAKVQAADRLDLIAYRTLGDPEQAWRIADANDAMNPPDLLLRPTLRVPLPELSPVEGEQEEPSE